MKPVSTGMLVPADRCYDGIGMTANTVCALVDGHVMALAQKPGRGKSGDSGPDNCDLETDIGRHAVGLSNELYDTCF